MRSTLFLQLSQQHLPPTLNPGEPKMSTLGPARIIGETRKGLLRVGNDADLILLDDRVNLYATIIRGRMVFKVKDW